MADRGAIARQAQPAQSQPITGTPVYPDQVWTRPLALGHERGQLYWTKGSNRLFRPAPEDQTPVHDNAQRWYNGGVLELQWAVAAGEQTFTATVRVVNAADPRPAVRILKQTALNVSETYVEAPEGVNEPVEIAVTVQPTVAGVLRVRLEVPHISEGSHIDWLTIANQ